MAETGSVPFAEASCKARHAAWNPRYVRDPVESLEQQELEGNPTGRN